MAEAMTRLIHATRRSDRGEGTPQHLYTRTRPLIPRSPLTPRSSPPPGSQSSEIEDDDVFRPYKMGRGLEREMRGLRITDDRGDDRDDVLTPVDDRGGDGGGEEEGEDRSCYQPAPATPRRHQAQATVRMRT